MKFLTFDGVSVTASDDLHMKQVVGGGTSYDVNHSYQYRSRQHPVLEDVTYNELRIPFTVERQGSTSVRELLSLFTVYGGFRRVEAEIDGTTVVVMAGVASISPHSATSKIYDGELVTSGVWEALSLSGPVTSSPVTVNGDLHALPVITITGGGVAATRHRYSIRDRTGRGLKAWDVRVPHNAAEVHVQGASIPFAVVGGNTWFRVGVRHDRPTLVDIRTGGDASPMKDTLESGTMVLSASTNTVRTYNGWIISRNPGGAANQWRPGVTEPVDRSTTSLTYGIDHEDDDAWQVRLNGTSVERNRYAFANDALSAVFTSPVEITSIAGLNRFVSKPGIEILERDGSVDSAYTSVRAAVRYRQDDQEDWLNAWQQTLLGQGGDDAISTGMILFPGGALQVSATLRVPPMPAERRATSGVVTFYQTHPIGTLILSGDPVVTYDAGKVPEITLLGSVSGRYVGNGTLTNETTGHHIGFHNVHYDTAGLVIDCNDLDINAVSGVHFGDITETDPAHLFKLVKGPNNWLASDGLEEATVSFQWRDRFIS